MVRISFTQDEIDALHYERFHHEDPAIRLKMEVLYLKSHGYQHKEIMKLCRIPAPRLRRFLSAYVDGGIDNLKQNKRYRPKSELEHYKDEIKAYFDEHPFASIKEAQSKIEELTGLKRGETQVRKFLKQLGFKRRKVGYVPGKATNPEKIKEQEEFKESELQPRLDEALAGKRTLFFMDAAHFVFAPFLGFLWCLTRVFIPSPTGRKRFNVLGALNAVTKEVITFTNESYINAESVCQLLLTIAQMNVQTPITIVLDNARYQRCALVQECARQLGIELLFLPSYSPNLNLIERYWKFVKKTCLYSKYYPDFKTFKGAIQTCLGQSHSEHYDELKSLLTLKFQSFENIKIAQL